MSSQMFKRFISYVGKTKLTDLPKDWQKTVDEVLVAQEKAVRFNQPTSLYPHYKNSSHLTKHTCIQNPKITKAEIKYAHPTQQKQKKKERERERERERAMD